MFGFLNVDKADGKTSRQIVSAVKRIARPLKLKVGHAGTLDPLATGVLVVCVGPATRLARFIQQQHKTYIADFRLGVTSDSLDSETQVHAIESAPVPTRSQLQDALSEFIGTIQQTPPAYSAIKINGRRAYELARKGEKFEISARPVEIHTLRLKDFSYPDFQVEIVCGSGTYVRSLGRDIALRLNSQAIMTHLVRTAIGKFRVEDSLPSAELTDNLDASQQLLSQQIVNPIAAFPDHAKVTVDSDLINHIRVGGILPESVAAAASQSSASPEIVAVSERGHLVAFMKHKAGVGYTPSINFADQHAY